jgi:Uma2 family endonuclease
MPPLVGREDWSLADLQEHLGGIPLERIRLHPQPGTATEKDVIEAERRGHLCELIDGTLVEKTVGFLESRLAVVTASSLEAFLDTHDLGIVTGADGTIKLMPGQVRIPDVAFFSWNRFPNRRLPEEPIPDLTPDLAIEVLSRGNTETEMQRKLRDYFTAGVRLVWYIDPRQRTARVYTAVDQVTVLGEEQSLSGGTVLPGFEVVLGELFARANRRGPAE